MINGIMICDLDGFEDEREFRQWYSFCKNACEEFGVKVLNSILDVASREIDFEGDGTEENILALKEYLLLFPYFEIHLMDETGNITESFTSDDTELVEVV